MFESIMNDGLNLMNVLICISVSLMLGILISLVHIKTSNSNKNFAITLALLPILVQIVMMMVNGNLGTSVAILGAFSLVRFRSIPGNSREITSIFFAMAIGLAVGMGQIYFAILIALIISTALIIFYKTKFGENKGEAKILKILIPETLSYEDVFEDVFKNYLKKYEIISIKTVNMGALFELKYNVVLKDNKTKEFIDDLRIKNGNLKITLSQPLNDNLL